MVVDFHHFQGLGDNATAALAFLLGAWLNQHPEDSDESAR